MYRSKNHLLGIITLSCASALCASGAVFAEPASVTSSANASVTVTTACTLTGTVTAPHSATISNGTYQANIGTTNLKTICNDPNGHAIYAVGFSGDEWGNNKMISTAGDSYNIATGTATSGDVSNWAMKLTAVSGASTPTILNGFNNYHAVPSTTTKVASYASGTANSTGSNLTTTYAAFISPTQPASTNTGQVKYILVHPQDAPEPGDVCNGIEANGVCYKEMQDFADNASTLKNAMVLEQQYQLIDNRDNKTYYVAKLADGNIWMTQNLDLGTTEGTMILTSDDTNLAAGTIYTLPQATPPSVAKADNRNILEKLGLSNNAMAVSPTPSSGPTPPGPPPSLDEDRVADVGELFIIGSQQYLSFNACISAGNTSEACQHGAIGNHYSFLTSTAGSASSLYAGDTLYSICPKGWKLPTGSTGGNFVNLVNVYNISGSDEKLITSPLWFVRSGYVDYSSLNYVGGSDGFYWSSTAADNRMAYNMYFYGSGINPATSGIRLYTFSIRCLAQ